MIKYYKLVYITQLQIRDEEKGQKHASKLKLSNKKRDESQETLTQGKRGEGQNKFDNKSFQRSE